MSYSEIDTPLITYRKIATCQSDVNDGGKVQRGWKTIDFPILGSGRRKVKLAGRQSQTLERTERCETQYVEEDRKRRRRRLLTLFPRKNQVDDGRLAREGSSSVDAVKILVRERDLLVDDDLYILRDGTLREGGRSDQDLRPAQVELLLLCGPTGRFPIMMICQSPIRKISPLGLFEWSEKRLTVSRFPLGQLSGQSFH